MRRKQTTILNAKPTNSWLQCPLQGQELQEKCLGRIRRGKVWRRMCGWFGRQRKLNDYKGERRIAWISGPAEGKKTGQARWTRRASRSAKNQKGVCKVWAYRRTSGLKLYRLCAARFACSYTPQGDTEGHEPHWFSNILNLLHKRQCSW